MSTDPVSANADRLDVTWHAGDAPRPDAGDGSLVFAMQGDPGWAVFAAADTTAPPPSGGPTVRYALGQADGPEGSFLGSTPFILSVRVYPPEPYRDDMIAWLEREHSERVRRIGGATWYLRYASMTGRFCLLNLWGLPDPALIETPAWTEANSTDWTRRLQPAMVGRDRAVYRLEGGPRTRGGR